VQDIKWDGKLFENLALPDHRLELIKTLVDARRNSSSFDDFVEGKGRGLVVNLFGKPGVGKTLTVEAVSDCTFMPHLSSESIHGVPLHPQTISVPCTL